MSFTKLLMAPINLFKKDVITFLIIKRHDLGATEEILRYIAAKPTASISMLRQKVWYLLDLPDYCEEVIILKTRDNVEIPLTELRKGNDPQHAYILEILIFVPILPAAATTKIHNNMLTMGPDVESSTTIGNDTSSESTCGDKTQHIKSEKFACDTINNSQSTLSNDTLALNKLRLSHTKNPIQNFIPELKKSELSCRISKSSLIFKMQGGKSRDNFASILFKIQSDLSALTKKLSSLENRIPS